MASFEEENTLYSIFDRPALAHTAQIVLLYLDVASLNTACSVSQSWNYNIREFITRKFLMLEDLVIWPAMTYEYKKQHMGGSLDGYEEDELEEMATELVCYHVKGFKDGKADEVINAEIQVLPTWKNKSPRELQAKDIKIGIMSLVNISLRKAVLNSMFPSSSGLRIKAENSFGKFENHIGVTLKFERVWGNARVDLVVTDDGGQLVVQRFWLVFLGSKVKHMAQAQGTGLHDFLNFAENEEEAVFSIRCMTLSNDMNCSIHMPGYM